MSYNNLHSYWSSRHRNDMAENSICWKREREERRRQSFEENHNYHRQCEMLANTYSTFEEGRPFSGHNRRNQESLTEELTKEEKDKRLSRRKEKLAAFLFSEDEKLEQEMKEKIELEKQSDPWNMKAMKEKLELLRKEKEAEFLQEAERKLYQRKQMNSFEAERVRSQRMKKDTVDYWEKQLQYKQKEINDERARSARFEVEQRKEYERQGQLVDQEKKTKVAYNKVWIDGLKLQMQELKDREEQEKELRAEENKLIKYDQELQRIKEEQKELQESRKKRELSGILERQHKAKLRETALEVQKQLEEDKKLLESVFGKENQYHAIKSAKREKLKSDIEWMKSIISEQLKLEKERQAEIQSLYQEEAEKMWQKREAEWKQEREARHKLLTEVIDGLKTQVHEKIDRNRQEQEAAARERATTLHDVEKTEELVCQERKEIAANRELYKQELLSQMNEQQSRKMKERADSRQGEPPDYDTKPLPGLSWR